MPYIKQERRDSLCEDSEPQTAGELNFVFTCFLQSYFEEHSNYQGINDILGALEGAKMEFYRRVVMPYEEEKIKINGDIY